MTHYYALRLSVLIAVLLLGCGSNNITISGQVTYTFVPVNENGLDSSATEERPIRGVIVQLRSRGVVFSVGNTDEQGRYRLQVPRDASVTVVVRAELGSVKTPNTRVISNTNENALYELISSTDTKTQDITDFNFNATTSFDTSQQYLKRNGAPFAILDTLYTAQQKIRSIDPNIIFPPLTVNWSEQNTSQINSDNTALGDIGTSFYTRNQLFILGDADTDADEYDRHVIAHEWSHYFEDNFSRSDSIGGQHGNRSILDATVAFSEGFANAWAAILLDDSNYRDTDRSGIAVAFDVDEDLVPNSALSEFDNSILVDGYYSEYSIQGIIYDLYDSGANDDDSTSIPLVILYDTLTGPQKDTTAFTTIFSFLTGLKTFLSANQLTEVNIISAAENIFDSDAFGDAIGLYTTIHPDSSPIRGNNLNTFSGLSEAVPGGQNKLHNRRFFRVLVTTPNCYKIDVVSNRTADKLGIFLPSVLELKPIPQFKTFGVGSHAFAVGGNTTASYTVQVTSATTCL